jgi:hypothetical protein
MKTKTLVIVGLTVVFVLAIGAALLRELSREEATLAKSISGVVEVSPQLAGTGVADIVRTDRLVLVLVDPQTRQPVAMRFESPLVPPQTIRIGESDARGATLTGPYLVVGITDKDGEIYKVTPGEVYGRSPQPVALGTEEYRLVLTEPFRGSLFNEDAVAPALAGPPAQGTPPAGAGGPGMGGRSGMGGSDDADPRYSIAGTITVSPALQKDVSSADRLIIMLFDPQQARPAAFKIIPHTLLPQRFTITLPADARGDVREGYSLRILTDKDDNPFGSAPGEVIGRSEQPIPLGTLDLNFVLDQPYTR